MPAVTSSRYRTRKLLPKALLPIVHEAQLDAIDEEAQRNVPAVETGVEKGEEVVSRFLLMVFDTHAAFFDVPFFAQCLVIASFPTPKEKHKSRYVTQIHHQQQH